MTELPASCTSCPACRVPLTGAERCRACGLRLTGPQAARLWEVDVLLLELEATRQPLLRERSELLTALRAEPDAPVPAVGSAPAPAEASAWGIQSTLLALGALLLAGAATVFAAVTYERLGAAGRAAVLVVLAALVLASLKPLVQRRLVATAEAVSLVGLAVTTLAVFALRRAGLADSVSLDAYGAGAAAVVGAVAAATAAAFGLRAPRSVAPSLGVLAGVLAVVALEPSPAGGALGLSLLVAAGVAALVGLEPFPLPRGLRLAVAVPLLVVAALALTAAASWHGAPLARVALIVLAVAAGGAATIAAHLWLRTALAAVPVPLVAGVLASLTSAELPRVDVAVAIVAPAVMAAAAALRLHAGHRPGALLGAAGATAAALALHASAAAELLLGPLLWLEQRWTLRPGAGADVALLPDRAWSGGLATLVVLLAAAAVATLTGQALDRAREGQVAAGGFAALALLALPVATGAPYAVALAVLLLSAAGLVAGGSVRTSPPLLALAAVPLVVAAAWSVADRTATLAVLPLAAAVAAAAARPRTPASAPAAALSALLAGGALVAAGAAAGLPLTDRGVLLALGVAGCLAVAGVPRLPSAVVEGTERAAVMLGLAALALSAAAAAPLSLALGVLGLAALATALRPDRRGSALLGALLLAASSWVRLADAGVEAPEAYTLPLSLVALGVGYLRRQQDPRLDSVKAYAGGLAGALVPSLLYGLEEDGPTRLLLVALASVAVVLVGSRARLKAPLLVGGGVLTLATLRLLAPYAEALPRWLGLAVAGALLVGVGATFEQRRRDLGRLSARYAALD